MIEVRGKGNNIARLIKHSVSASGIELLTWELEYWRGWHSENMTHRMLSKNSSSTRAIPISKAIDLIRQNPGMPIHWGLNNPGMQSNVEMDVYQASIAKTKWLEAMESAISFAIELSDKNGINGHKQWVGRLLEAFSCMKVVQTGTEFSNYDALRDHKDAQPEFADLVRCMKKAKAQSTPDLLKAGEWHLPYITTKRIDGKLTYWASDDTQIDLDTARKVSASCCAQASYRKLDDTLEKALDVYEKLKLDGTSDSPKHASPVEHQATPMDSDNIPFNPNTWENGVTHVRRDGSLWSGNFRGWIQHRQLIPNEAVW
jgi:hypothetical protein